MAELIDLSDERVRPDGPTPTVTSTAVKQPGGQDTGNQTTNPASPASAAASAPANADRNNTTTTTTTNPEIHDVHSRTLSPTPTYASDIRPEYNGGSNTNEPAAAWVEAETHWRRWDPNMGLWEVQPGTNQMRPGDAVMYPGDNVGQGNGTELLKKVKAWAKKASGKIKQKVKLSRHGGGGGGVVGGQAGTGEAKAN